MSPASPVFLNHTVLPVRSPHLLLSDTYTHACAHPLLSSHPHPLVLSAAGLAQREAANPAFFFLKPTHSMFGLFTRLADAYSAVLMPDKGLRTALEADAADR